jgi:hypothetical protein
VRSPWHLDGRSIAYKMSKFLEGDESSEASQVAVQARNDAIIARNEAVAAGPLAQAWAERPVGQDVTTPGTRSALHYASTASGFATAAASAQAQTAILKGQVDVATALAQAWASKSFGQDVAGPGTRSGLHWATLTASDRVATAADAATSVTAKDDSETARDLSQEWAEKAHGQAVTNTASSYSSKHWAAESAASAAAAAAIVFAGTNTIDYGMITDVPTDFADYGTLP